MKYLFVLEPTSTGFSAYVPDLPGCVSTGHSREEAEHNLQEAVEFHLDGMREDGLPIPAPSTQSGQIEVALAA